MNSKAPDHDGIIAAAELACGLLWMIEDHRHPHTKIAFESEAVSSGLVPVVARPVQGRRRAILV